jgi:hypothetical protein
MPSAASGQFKNSRGQRWINLGGFSKTLDYRLSHARGIDRHLNAKIESGRAQ